MRKVISVRLDELLLERIEEARGHRDRTAFIDEAIEEKLASEAEPKSRAPRRQTLPETQGAHRANCRCPVCTA